MPDKPYKTLKDRSTAEITVKKSVFIANASPVSDEKSAAAFVAEMKKKYSDARHNVSAYLLTDSVMHSSDDGEPSGTGGTPVLGALKNSGLLNIVCVVTRYFGGILLGAPGLARAYSSAAEAAIKSGETVLYRQYTDFTLSCAYSDYDKVKYILDKLCALITGTTFAEGVVVSASLPDTDYPAFVNDVFIKENKNITVKEAGRRFGIS